MVLGISAIPPLKKKQKKNNGLSERAKIWGEVFSCDG
jgi:hypothetical protein